MRKKQNARERVYSARFTHECEERVSMTTGMIGLDGDAAAAVATLQLRLSARRPSVCAAAAADSFAARRHRRLPPAAAAALCEGG